MADRHHHSEVGRHPKCPRIDDGASDA
jgi:hypothetical protein